MKARYIVALFACWPGAGDAPSAQTCVASEATIEIAPFDVSWIGFYEAERNNEGFAALDKGCDIVVMQELVLPSDAANERIGKPVSRPDGKSTSYPNGDELKVDDGATDFFNAMIAAGFGSFVLSEEDSGPSDKQHNNSAATERFVAFYKPNQVCIPWDQGRGDLHKGGCIARDLTANVDYDRVPFAFPFAHFMRAEQEDGCRSALGPIAFGCHPTLLAHRGTLRRKNRR